MKHSTNLKTFKLSLSLAVTALAISLGACDNVSDADRFIELPAVEANRVVLLEEFTGQLCVNCPNAHETVAELLSQYPDNLISVSFHGGGDNNSISEDHPSILGLRTAESEQYCSENNIIAYPAGVVNRSTDVLNKDQWAGAIRDALQKATTIEMNVSANISSDNSKLEITTEITPLDNGSGYLQLWVVESGIVAYQLSKDGMKTDYVHNHVFRTSVNGHNGEAMQFEIRQPQIVNHTIEVSPKWNPANLSVVAFVYNSNGIVQATSCALNNE